MTDRHGRQHEVDPGAIPVTLCGPFDYRDVEDLATGLRFIGGKAVGVPLSVATEIANRRRGYYIEPHGKE